MSMTTHVQLLRDPDAPDHEKKVRAMEVLIDARCEIPKSLLDYFGITHPNEFRADTSGLVVKDSRNAVMRWTGEEEEYEGYEVRVRALPEGVVTVRFYNAL